jgi:hypothetical protein
MVHIDMQITLGLDLEIEQGMAGKEFEHVVEKTDPRSDLMVAGAVKIEAHGNVSFAGLSRNGCLPHIASSKFGKRF